MNEKTQPTKSGSEFIESFFDGLEKAEDETLDKNVIKVVLELYRSNKLSNKNLSNEFLKLRESKGNSSDDENQED